MDLYQHFRAEEQTFIDQALDWKEQVERQYKVIVTDFLDPREQAILESIIGKQEEFKLSFFGGYDHAERKQAILAPFYEEINQQSYHITVLQGSYHQKFVTLNHRDVLGTLMSLGIQRKKVGDLIVDDGTLQIILEQEIAVFVQMQLTKIKNTSINLTEISSDDILPPDYDWEVIDTTVSSTRLDVVLKEIYQMSRQKTQDFIKKEAVKVNYRIVDDPSFSIQPGDLISLRKKGRSKVLGILGETKKQKYIVRVSKLK